MRHLRLLGLAFATACGSAPAETVLPLSFSTPVQVVPSADMPAEVVSQEAHNNLDVVRHDGRVFFAFRTAPSHFASPDVVLYVVSSADQRTWEHEVTFAAGTDLREPRFLSWHGELWLFYAELGDDPRAFEPGLAKVSRYAGPGQWSAPETFYEPGFIPWRARVVDDTPYLIGYTGGDNIYNPSGAEPIDIHWLTTSDGETWTGVVPGQPVVHRGGGSETDFAFLDDGTAVLVVRNEEGEGTVFGSKICRTAPGGLGNWTCVYDVRKYDSPLLIDAGDDIYLIGRRNLSDTGAFDLGLADQGYDHAELYLTYQGDYWFKPKRCALWKVDPMALRVQFLLDLPSRGDTCFASAVDQTVAADGHYELDIYNYTSPLDGPDLSWIEGQGGTTAIYRTHLVLPPPGGD